MNYSGGRELTHTHKIRVRYSDTDKMGFVYNGNYLTFFEMGRTELMRAYGLPYTQFENAGYFLPLTESYVKYKAPAYYDDILHVQARIIAERKALIRFDYKIFKKDKLISEGYTTHMFMKADTQKAVKPPKFFYDIVENGKKLY